MERLSFSQYGSRLLKSRAEELLRHKEGTLLGSDIEALHEMRVASRRLRTALWIFKDLFPESFYASSRDEIRMVTRALGAARDLDTHIAYLEAQGSSAAGLRRKRKSLQSAVVKAVRRLDRRRIVERLISETKRISSRSARSSGCPSDRATHLYKLARKKISACLDDLMAYREYAGQPDSIHELHQLRIAAKHLRYTLENFRGVYGRPIDTYIACAKKIQRTLGDFHNYAVWGRAGRFKEEFERGRLEAYNRFLKVWRRQEHKEVWKRLKKSLKVT